MSVQGQTLIETIHVFMEVPISKDMADAIRKKILDKYEDSGMSQDEFAIESGVPQATISNWFRGKKGITIETLRKLASVFNLDVESGAFVRLVPDSH